MAIGERGEVPVDSYLRTGNPRIYSAGDVTLGPQFVYVAANASPGGKTERLCVELLARGKPLYTLEDPANGNLVKKGARPVRLGQGMPLPWS